MGVTVIKIEKLFIPISLVLIIVVIISFYFIQSKRNKIINIIYIAKTVDPTISFWNHVNKGMEVAIKEVGVNFKVYGPEVENEVELQNKYLMEAINEKPDAIILAASSYNGSVDICKEAVENGIKLITVDSGIDSDVVTSFIGTDNFEAGMNVGKEISKLVSTGGKILVVSYVKDVNTSIDRETGLLSELSDEQRENIVGPFYCNSIVEDSKKITLRELQNNSEIDGIVGLNGPSVEGIILAVKELGLENKVKIVGMDSSLGGIKGLEDGTVSSLILQNPFNMGYLSVILANDAATGKKIPEYMNTGVQIVTKENMYSKENQKILFIFDN